MFEAGSFHYTSCFGASSELAPNMFGASSELASVMEFGLYLAFDKSSCGSATSSQPASDFLGTKFHYAIQ